MKVSKKTRSSRVEMFTVEQSIFHFLHNSFTCTYSVTSGREWKERVKSACQVNAWSSKRDKGLCDIMMRTKHVPSPDY